MSFKNFKDICWDVDEPTYRKDPAYSYSTLARYERDGYEELNHLFDKISTPSLVFGSIVDCILTDGEAEFDRRYSVVSIGQGMTDKDKEVCDDLVNIYGDKFPMLEMIPEQGIIDAANNRQYQQRWLPKTRAKNIVEKCSNYYISANSARGKEVVDADVVARARRLVDALRTSDATKYYFGADIPDGVERIFQAKFRGKILCSHNEGKKELDFRCMADLIIVDHNKKLVIPCDLKTTGHSETIFYDSFDKWSYQIQARLYWRLIRDAMDKDDFYKDYELGDYMFIVGNAYRCKPIVWRFSNPGEVGDIYFEKSKRLFRDFRKIAYELDYYLSYKNENGKWPEKFGIYNGDGEYNDLRSYL